MFFEKGWLDLDPATDYYRHNMKINRQVPRRSHVAGDVVEWSSVTEDVPIPPKNQFALELDHMTECVLQKQDAQDARRRRTARCAVDREDLSGRTRRAHD